MLDRIKHLSEEGKKKVVSTLEQLFDKAGYRMDTVCEEANIVVEACYTEEEIIINFIFCEDKPSYAMGFSPTEAIFNDVCERFEDCVKSKMLEEYVSELEVPEEKAETAYKFMKEYNRVFIESSSKAFFKCVIR